MSTCPGFLSESVLPAVLVNCISHNGEETGANLEKPEIRCCSRNCSVLVDLKEIHGEPTCNYFFMQNFFPEPIGNTCFSSATFTLYTHKSSRVSILYICVLANWNTDLVTMSVRLLKPER